MKISVFGMELVKKNSVQIQKIPLIMIAMRNVKHILKNVH